MNRDFRQAEYMNIKVKDIWFKMPRQSSEKLETGDESREISLSLRMNALFSYNALIRGTSGPCYEAVRLRTMPFCSKQSLQIKGRVEQCWLVHMKENNYTKSMPVIWWIFWSKITQGTGHSGVIFLWLQDSLFFSPWISYYPNYLG